jgi:hypothetical protein
MAAVLRNAAQRAGKVGRTERWPDGLRRFMM